MQSWAGTPSFARPRASASAAATDRRPLTEPPKPKLSYGTPLAWTSPSRQVGKSNKCPTGEQIVHEGHQPFLTCTSTTAAQYCKGFCCTAACAGRAYPSAATLLPFPRCRASFRTRTLCRCSLFVLCEDELFANPARSAHNRHLLFPDDRWLAPAFLRHHSCACSSLPSTILPLCFCWVDRLTRTNSQRHSNQRTTPSLTGACPRRRPRPTASTTLILDPGFFDHPDRLVRLIISSAPNQSSSLQLKLADSSTLTK